MIAKMPSISTLVSIELLTCTAYTVPDASTVTSAMQETDRLFMAIWLLNCYPNL
jgi:hypothetical protein